MPVKYYLKTGALIALVFFALAMLSVNFIDKPLALFIHARGFDQWHILSLVTEHGIVSLIIFSLLILGIFPTDELIWKRVALIVYAVILAYLAIWIRRKLGVICARSWPNVWMDSGIYGGLIGDGQFGFHFFQPTSWKGSFPSGHSVETSYISCIMFLIYSQFKYKYLWWIPVIAMVTCQVLQNFHFFGDCLAGVALGVLVAYWAFGFYLWLPHRMIK